MRGDSPAFTGAVLAGGASSRMGTDKALIEVNGRALVTAAATALRDAGASSVIVIGGDREALRRLGLEVHPDDDPGQGPLGGLLTALRLATDEIVMVLACDMPAIDAESVRTIVDALAGAPRSDLAVPVVEARRQCLTAAYRRRSATHLAAAYAGGERAPRRAIVGLEVVEVMGLDEHRLGDVDRPDDLHRYARRQL